jgi:hypothetical protein
MTGFESEINGGVKGGGGGLMNDIEADREVISKEMSAGKGGGGERGGGGGGPRNPVALTDLATHMADFAADREWDQFHSPRNLLLALVCFFPVILSCFSWIGFRNERFYVLP